MKVPASMYSALFAVAMVAQALAPASAAAEAANPGAGECEALSGGVYFNFTTEQFCDPAGSGGGAAGSGGSGGASGGGGGSTATEPSPGVIVIHDPLQGGTYCGSFTDAFVDRPQDCLNRGVKTNCSPVDGCLKCPEEGCRAGSSLSPSEGGKGAVPKKKSSAATIREYQACLQLAIDQRALWRDYGDLPRYLMSLGFTWEETAGLVKQRLITSGPGKGTVIFSTAAGKRVEVSAAGLPDSYMERRKAFRSKGTFIIGLMKRYDCRRRFPNIVKVEESDVYYPLGYPSR